MEFKDDDLLHLTNLVKALDVAKYPDLRGEDIIAFYRMFVWISELQSNIKKEIAETKSLSSIKIKTEQELKSPIKQTKSKKTKGL